MKAVGIYIRLLEDDKQAIEKDAEKLGLSMTALVRLLYKQWVVLGKPPLLQWPDYPKVGARLEHGRHTKIL